MKTQKDDNEKERVRAERERERSKTDGLSFSEALFHRRLHRGPAKFLQVYGAPLAPSGPICHQRTYWNCGALKTTQVQQVFKTTFHIRRPAWPGLIINNGLLIRKLRGSLWL